jgi:hypothetical protein
MRRLWRCRRTFVGTLAIASLTALGFYAGQDVAGAIGTVVIAIAGSNMAQKVGERKYSSEKNIYSDEDK